ncbi:SH3 domain protein [Teladorsagia circumcincta]|uniref:SH3 domain protein n=1 Tax=Teladorsagia circumcincta TaxID=45464 RepID=A0A2G9UYV8_TELCI|nr:SH3 domain protein [Teladorsagia circumcincta]
MTAPPRPAPKPGRVRVYRALYDYEARSDQEMSFAEGDLLYVSDSGPNDDWLPAACGGKKGLVPANYGSKCSVFIVSPHFSNASQVTPIFTKCESTGVGGKRSPILLWPQC